MSEKLVIEKLRETFGEHNENYSDDKILKAYEGTLILSGVKFSLAVDSLMNKIFRGKWNS